MPKTKFAFKLVALLSIAAPLASCNNKSNTAVTTPETEEETTLSVSLSDTTFTYDGKNHSISVYGELPENVYVTYQGNNQSETGDYNVLATFHNSVDTTKKYKSVSAVMRIVDSSDSSDFSSNVSSVVFPDQTVTYTGSAANLKVDNLPANYTVTYSQNDGKGYIDSGTYIVYATISDETGTKTYKKSAILTILPKETTLQDIKFNSRTYVYNGTTRSLAIEGELPSYLSVQYSNNNQVDAGTYTVTATFVSSDKNIKAPSPMYATLRIVDEYSHTVTFIDANGRTLSTIPNVVDGTTLSEESVPNYLSNYPSAYIKNYDANLISNIRSDVTVMVTYTLNEFGINYVVPHGTNNALNPANYTYEDYIQFEEPNIDKGYYFVGYYEDSAYTKPLNSIALHSVGDKTIYAKVEEVPESGVTLKNFYKVYDGNPIEVAPSGNVLSDDNYSFTYYDKSGNQLSSQPINAGVYTVVMEYSRKSTINPNKYDRLKDFTSTIIIEKATTDVDFTITGNSGVSYQNGVYHKTYSPDSNVSLSITNLPNYLTYTVTYYNENNLQLSSYPTNAGSYYARFSFTADSNHTTPNDIIENIVISKQEIKLTSAEKKAIFADATYNYEKGTTYTLSADLSKVPSRYKDILSVSNYYNNQSASVGTTEASAFLYTLNDNYYINDNELKATLTIQKSANSRKIIYVYNGHEISYYLNGTYVTTLVQSEVGSIAPELTISEELYSNSLSLSDANATANYNFLGKDGYKYGWTNVSWKLTRDLEGNNEITDNVIPTGGNNETTYYMQLIPTKLNITVTPFVSNLALTTPSSITLDQDDNITLSDVFSSWTIKSGYELSYFYTDPKNPAGTKVTSINAEDYYATDISNITVYPMINTVLVDANAYKVYYRYSDKEGNIQDINADSPFLVSLGDVIPLYGEISEEGYVFSGWYIQDDKYGTDVLTYSKKLNSNHTIDSTITTKEIYIYGALSPRNYDIIVNFDGAKSYTITIEHLGTITDTDKEQLRLLAQDYFKSHPEYDSSYEVKYLTSAGGAVDLLDDAYVFSGTSNLVLNASFTKASYYTRYTGIDGLDFYNSQNGNRGILQTEDSSFILPTVKEKTGYTFKRWLLKAERNFEPLVIYTASIVNLSDIYSYENNGQLTLEAVFEPNSYLAFYIYNDGVNSPVSASFSYNNSKFYLNKANAALGIEAETRIMTTDSDGNEIVSFTAPERKGYKFLGFYIGDQKLSTILDTLNYSINNDSSLTEAQKEEQRKIFKFDYNVAITCKYEKITYQIRFYDNRNNRYNPYATTDEEDSYIRYLDNFYFVNYDDIFALSSNISYDGMKGYKVEGFYLEYNTDPTVDPTLAVSTKITDVTTCSDYGTFKPSEVTIEDGKKPIINVYINLVPETYYLTLLEDVYTTNDANNGNVNRTFKTKTVAVKYGQKLSDVVVDSYTISDGKGGYITKEIKLIDEMPIKDGYDFNGWILSTRYDATTSQYINNTIFGYQVDKNGDYVLDGNGNKIRIITDTDGNDVLYNYDYNMTIVVNYAGRVLDVNYKYEVENAGMIDGRYTNLTLTGDVNLDDILNSTSATGLNSSFKGTANYADRAKQYTILDAWMLNYVKSKNLDNRTLDTSYVASWYYVRYEDYNKTTGEYETITKVAVTSSTTFKSTDKVDLVCTFTCPTSPVSFFDSTSNTSLATTNIHSNVPLMLKMTPEYKRDSSGNATTEINKYVYQLIELVDNSTSDTPNYAQLSGNIRTEFSIYAPSSSSAYSFDGVSFTVTYGNEQDGAPASIVLSKVSSTTSTSDSYQFIFEPGYETDERGNITKKINNYISNPGTVIFTPTYVPRNNIRVAFYTSTDMNSNTLFSSQYVASGGSYDIPSTKPAGEKGQIFVGWVLKGGDTSTVLTTGTFTADGTSSSINYYAKYEYTDIHVTYRIGSEVVLVKQVYDGEASTTTTYSKDYISKSRIVIGGYEFNGNKSYNYDPDTGRGSSTDAGCVYNHYRITKWKVVDENGNLVYTRDPYVTSGSMMYLSALLNVTASNIYLEPYDEGEYVGVAVTYSINNVTYGPFIVDEKVEFTPYEVLSEDSLLYQHGLRSVYTDGRNFLSSTYVHSEQKTKIDFKSSAKLKALTLTGYYAYNVEDGVLSFNTAGEIDKFDPTGKEDTWSSVILPGYYYVKSSSGSIQTFQIVTGIADGKSSDSVFATATGRKIIRAVSFPSTIDASKNTAYSKIGSFAFNGCTNLTTITFSQYTKTIGDFAFANCSNLRGIECPLSLKNIGKGAFFNNKNLGTLTFNKNLETIGDSAFGLGTYATDTFSLSYKSGDDSASGVTAVSKLVFPLSLKSIGKAAFVGRGSLSSISWIQLTEDQRYNNEWGNDCSIGDYAFAIAVSISINASYLDDDNPENDEDVVVKNSITKESDPINYWLDSEYDVEDDVDSYDVRSISRRSIDTIYADPETKLIPLYNIVTDSSSRVLERDISISFPRQLASIGVGAFKYRRLITSLKFYDVRDDIQYEKKPGQSWTQLVIKDNAFRITPYEDYYYSYETGIKDWKTDGVYTDRAPTPYRITINLPMNLTSVGKYAFAYRYDDISFDDSPSYVISERDYLTIKDCAFTGYRRAYTQYSYMLGDTTLSEESKQLVLPARTYYIGNCSFYNRDDFRGVLITNYNTDTAVLYHIGDYAFAKLSFLDLYQSSNSDEYLFTTSKHTVTASDSSDSTHSGDDNNSFVDYYEIQSMFVPTTPENDTSYNIYLPNSIVSIGNGAFMFHCFATEVVFATSDTTARQLKSLGDEAFEFCTNLITLRNDLCDSSNTLTFNSLGAYVFRGCINLSSNGSENLITIPTAVEVISEGVFASCVKLENVNFSSSTSNKKDIGDYAFYRCEKLKTVDNNNNAVSFRNINSVGSRAFENCVSLSSITFDGNVLGQNIEGSDLITNTKSSVLKTMRIPNIYAPKNTAGVVGDSLKNYAMLTSKQFEYTKGNDSKAAKNNACINLINEPGLALGYDAFDSSFIKSGSLTDLEAVFNASTARDIALINYTLDYSPFGTRAFYVSSDYKTNLFDSSTTLVDCKINFANSTKYVYVMSPFALARYKANITLNGSTSSLQDMFPTLIANSMTSSSGGILSGKSDINEYYKALDASDGGQGVIGSCAFNTGTTLYLSNKSLYLRTKYIAPYGLNNVTIRYDTNLNRVGNDSRYVQIETIIHNVSKSNKGMGQHYETFVRAPLEGQTEVGNLSEYFDFNYVITPLEFAGTTITNNAKFYCDGRVNYLGMAYMNGNVVFQSKSRCPHAHDTYKMYHNYNGNITCSGGDLNWFDMTSPSVRYDDFDLDSLAEANWSVLSYGNGYAAGMLVSLGIYGTFHDQYTCYKTNTISIVASAMLYRARSQASSPNVSISYTIGAQDYFSQYNAKVDRNTDMVPIFFQHCMLYNNITAGASYSNLVTGYNTGNCYSEFFTKNGTLDYRAGYRGGWSGSDSFEGNVFTTTFDGQARYGSALSAVGVATLGIGVPFFLMEERASCKRYSTGTKPFGYYTKTGKECVVRDALYEYRKAFHATDTHGVKHPPYVKIYN